MIAAVILAAGESSRLGQPKQLLTYHGRTLLRHAVECATQGGCAPVLVVLGARADEIERTLEGTAVHRVHNPTWSQGIGNSVRAGVAALQRRWPRAEAVLVLACDQPRVTPALVRRILAWFERGGAAIIACEYAGTVGIPTLFARSLFSELLALSGPAGARSVLEAHRDACVGLPWPDGAIDIDRPGDLPRLA